MAVDNRSTSALFKRAEQLRRWQDSETNKTDVTVNNRNTKVNFSDGCIFLAACAAGDKQEVLRLLEKGADINTANVDGLTGLHAACIDDNIDMVEFLVNQGADVNRADMEGWTPLHATASCGFISIAKFLIDRGADLSIVNNDGDLPFDIADSEEMESLLKKEIESRGIDCDASRNEEERMMLEDAQRWLAAGFLADRPHPKTGATALHVAAAKGYSKVMSLLLEAGSDINAQDLDGWTPLHAAAHWCQRDAVEILCEHMADMDKQNFVGQTAYDVADSTLLLLMDELKRKQKALKLVNTNKQQVPRKRKTSPHREHSNKKEREDLRESDEKKNKVNKEKNPQIIPTSPDKNNTRTVPQAKGDNAMDESEVQSWRRPSSLRKPLQDDKNQEVSRTISTPTRVNNRESEDLTGKRISLPEKDERSFVPPSRDEESETQRKAHAKMVRSTRRSTQGVTLEDIKSAEQLMKNKQQQASTSSPESKESSASTVSTSVPQGSTTTTTTPSSPKPASPTKSEDEERRPSWRLKVDDADKTKFCLENVRSKDKQEDNDSDTQTVTVQLRKKNTEDKGDEDQKDNERNSQTREGTQAAIQRRKKPKRRSTGRVQVNMDEIDPEKRAQRLAEQQQQQQQDDNRSDDGEEEDDSSVSERGDSKGPTSSHGSSAVNSRPSSRGSSLGPENGDIDYKKLYEEQLEENFRVHERLRGTETELRLAREAIETNNKKNNTRLAMAEADKREKRALERKLSEMEEELKLLEHLKQENQRLKDENGALIRVISKLSK
ncbi:protein phosphatase 1 regulatory subunit 12A isoform X38 [Macrobrachium rosenbergii]|uniref:protein phosphatase 1 regulatory subunit 12A isoform X38 n=1 Tax=Macrobrachium rosenbergii TaxID=79674 RepID=UPI0034D470ED